MTYKPILVTPVLIALLTMIGVTTNVYVPGSGFFPDNNSPTTPDNGGVPDDKHHPT